jgi:hypothetical protein
MNCLRFIRLSALPFAFAALVGTQGCSDADTVPQTGDVTDIANSEVKDQSIGNCWVYASVGWAESLRLTHSGEELNLSESYVTYWHWFEQIRGGAPGEEALADLGNNELSTGGWWATAVELMRRYGVMDEGAFIPDEAEAPRSDRQKTALAKINESLKNGVLKTAAKRGDAKVVRTELNKAWGLSTKTIGVMDKVFTKGVTRTMYDNPTIPANSGLRTVQSIMVGHNASGKELSLADAIGEPIYSGWGPPRRSGTYAWNEESYPYTKTDRRKFQIRIQEAMHRRLPAIMTWYVDFNALKNDNTFQDVPGTPGRQGGHMTVLEDYQIKDVPGYGTLAAGVVVTDPAKLEAALSPQANIEFFRIKNSWGEGLSPDPNQGDKLKGYYDLWMTYLNASIPKAESEGGGTANGLSGVVLPPAAFESGGGTPEDPPEPPPGSDCAHDLCDTGAALDPACDPCVAQIGEADPFCVENSWDDVCVGQVSSVCGQTCQ